MEAIQPVPVHPDIRHHDTGFSSRGIRWFIVALVLTVAASSLFVVFLFGFLNSVYPGARRHPGELRYEPTPNPKLQTSPQADLATMQQQDRSVLNSYGWVDRNVGLVRIPISRAMELIVERGLPVRQTPRSGGPELLGKSVPTLPPPPGSPLSGEEFRRR